MYESIKVRLDLNVNPHDVLDYNLTYHMYLPIIKNTFYGYISQKHFMELMIGTEGEKKGVLKALINDKWLGVVKMGTHNMLYLKRKSMILIDENPRQGDLKKPSMYQTLRSVMIGEFFKQDMKCESGEITNLFSDVYYHKTPDSIEFIVLDTQNRKKNDYQKLFEDIINQDMLDNNFGKEALPVCITFYSYGSRFNVMNKHLSNVAEDIITFYNAKSFEKGYLSIESYSLDVLPFFNNHEPLL